MADEILQRLDRIELVLSTLNDRLACQVAVTEALRSDVRMLTSLIRVYADLSIRVTDLENPEPRP